LDTVYDVVLFQQKLHGTMVPWTAALKRSGLGPDFFGEAVAIWAEEDVLQVEGDMLWLTTIVE